MVAPELYYQTSLADELQRFPAITTDDIATIRQWLSTQPHLPPVLDVQIAHILQASYYDVEVAKSTIEHYFTYKSTMTEFFTDWDPLSAAMKEYVDKVIYAGFLPQTSPTDGQVILMRLNDPAVDLYSFNRSVKWLLMSVSALLLQQGQQPDFKIVYDADLYTMSHVMRNPLTAVKHYLDFGTKASAIRVVEIHFINSSSVVKKLISIIKPFMSKHIMKMLTFHTSADGFFQTLPKERIPVEYGGTAPSLETLHAENVVRVQSLRENLIWHSGQKTDENKRVGKKKKSKVEDFKKLEID